MNRRVRGGVDDVAVHMYGSEKVEESLRRRHLISKKMGQFIGTTE